MDPAVSLPMCLSLRCPVVLVEMAATCVSEQIPRGRIAAQESALVVQHAHSVRGRRDTRMRSDEIRLGIVLFRSSVSLSCVYLDLFGWQLTRPFHWRWHKRRPFDLHINKVEPHTSFALAAALATVHALRHGFVALQVPFAACQAACPNALGLGTCCWRVLPGAFG